MKTKNFKLKPLVLGVQISAALFSSTAFSAGFYLNEHSSNGLGRAFAGQAAMAENSTILYSNPAAITSFDETSTSFFISHVNPNIDVQGEVSITTPVGTTTYDADQDEIADAAIIPAAFVVHPLNDSVSVGVGLYSNFGLATEFDNDFNALHFANKAEIKTITINPTVAYKFNDEVSVGFGLNYVMAEAELATALPAIAANTITALTGNPTPAGLSITAVEGDDTAYAWNIGLHWAPSAATEIGFSYRSEVAVELDGEISSDIIPTFRETRTGTVDIDLPATAEIAISQGLTEDFSVQASLNWFGWSSFDVLVVEFDNEAIPDFDLAEEYFEDTMRYSVGGTYSLNESLTLRGGYAFDEGGATDEHRTLGIPDTDRQWVSFGATYEMNEDMSVDFGVVQIFGRDAKLQEEVDYSAIGLPISSEIEAEHDATATLLSAQLNYSF